MEQLIKKILLEFKKNRQSNPFPEFIRKTLEKIYKPKGMWKKIEDPDNGCVTNFGVVGGKYQHIPNIDQWSILNRFDTNSKVKNKLIDIFLKQNPNESPTDVNLMSWISTDDNATQLFDEGGKYIEELVNLNIETVEKGNKNEMFAISTVKTEFNLNDQQIKRFCTGSVEDTKQGKDFAFNHQGQWYTVQTKPFNLVRSLVDEYGETFFEVSPIYFSPEKYSEKNVDFYLFVKETNYIMFQNIHQRIRLSRNNLRFYEPPVRTNMSFETKIKKPSKKSKEISTKFGMSDNQRKLNDLEFKRNQLDRLINRIKKEIDNPKG